MKKRVVIIGLLLPVVAMTGWFGMTYVSSRSVAQVGGGDSKSPRTAIPVMADTARRGDVPIYLTGLGTVQAYNSVVVKTRVDGQILKIGFAEGQEVRVGDILAEIDPQPYEATLALSQATRLKDQAQLDNARLDLTRASRLVISGAGTTQQHDTSKSVVAQLEASIKIDQAMIDTAQVQLNYTRIRSPIAGRAGTRLLDVGNIVHAGDATGIVTINQIHPIFVSFALPAATLPELRTQMKAGDIQVTVEDGNGNDLAMGKLAVIDNQINAATATIAYKAAFDNVEEVLWPGQFVNVRLQLQVERDAITVPITAIGRNGDGTFVFVIGADRIIEKRAVTVRFSNKSVAVVDHGLAPGEQVVADGQYRIQAGSLVDILPQTPATVTLSGASAPSVTSLGNPAASK
jgi:multidrug efflux system membrane fusion protein